MFSYDFWELDEVVYEQRVSRGNSDVFTSKSNDFVEIFNVNFKFDNIYSIFLKNNLNKNIKNTFSPITFDREVQFS